MLGRGLDIRHKASKISDFKYLLYTVRNTYLCVPIMSEGTGCLR